MMKSYTEWAEGHRRSGPTRMPLLRIIQLWLMVRAGIRKHGYPLWCKQFEESEERQRPMLAVEVGPHPRGGTLVRFTFTVRAYLLAGPLPRAKTEHHDVLPEPDAA